jgi:hypothetical protein
MAKHQNVIGLEINPKFVGALFTNQVDDLIHVFCFYVNGEVAQFDMSAKDNLDGLRHFFTKMNMEETCSSVVIDEVVQGRFYVRSQEDHWLYTLLASPGNLLPLSGADICQLPWRTCWQSPEAEILEYGGSGDTAHCYAIRTAITETDAARLVKQSKAFINPVSVRRKPPRNHLLLNLGVGLACVGIPLALTLFYTLKPRAHAASEPRAAVAARAHFRPVSGGSGNRYYLLYNHQISGPYTDQTISAMRAGGLLNADAMCRADGATEWASLSTLFPALVEK